MKETIKQNSNHVTMQFGLQSCKKIKKFKKTKNNKKNKKDNHRNL